MAKEATKAIDNVYYRARKAAAEFNDNLNSREGAAEVLHINPTTLAKYELDILKVNQDTVVMMAELYNEPRLVNHYCTTECPIGKRYSTKIDEKDISIVSLQMLQNLRSVEKAKNMLLDITADGVISSDEVSQLGEIMDCFEKIRKTISELELWVNKNIKKEHSESAER